AGAAACGLDPRADLQASAQYRRELAQVLTRRALEQAFAREPAAITVTARGA
ncbi:MAG: hypothetical protein H7125_01870, partial [Proteobacteria bacterium]|nr:hypothetical protein [Burkholderiales bacterium]